MCVSNLCLGEIGICWPKLIYALWYFSDYLTGQILKVLKVDLDFRVYFNLVDAFLNVAITNSMYP